MFKIKHKLEQEYNANVTGIGNGVSGDFLFDESEQEETNSFAEQEIIIKSLFWQDADLPRIPYLKTEGSFRIHIRRIFGLDISIQAIESLRQDLLNSTLIELIFKVEPMEADQLGVYRDGIISLNKDLVESAIEIPTQRWILLLVMIEEFAHHLDYQLRNIYSSIGGHDLNGDEGRYFSASFIEYNQLLYLEIDFAEITIEEKGIQKKIISINSQSVPIEHKTEIYRATQSDRKHSGQIQLRNGDWEEVEFFKIEGQGALHEAITQDAAAKTGTGYDDALDFGVVWPDVPTNLDDTSIDTNYAGLWPAMNYLPNTLIYKSHNGKYAYWHSMSPDPNLTNKEIRELIIRRVEVLWKQAEEFRGQETESTSFISNDVEDHGLFFVGKILHMIQDSYSFSHTIRATHSMPDIQYKVSTNETLDLIAIKHDLTWNKLAIYNWNTDDEDEINIFLKTEVGCTKKINDNYIFESSNVPGIIKIPMPKINQIINFQDYIKQNQDTHGLADNGGDVHNNFRFIPGALDARDASIKILELYRDRAQFFEVEKYFLKHIYPFAPGVENNKSGVVPENYKTSTSEEMLIKKGIAVGDVYEDLREEFEQNNENIIKRLEAENVIKNQQ